MQNNTYSNSSSLELFKINGFELRYDKPYDNYSKELVANLIIQHNITKLVLTNKILVQLNSIPNNITELVLHMDVPYNLDDLPNSLTHLYMYNYSKNLDCLCDGILTLRIGNKFNHPVCNLPSTLEELGLGNEFNHPVDTLPQNLKMLELGNKFNFPINNLPSMLQILILGENFNQSLDMLPNTITYISISWIGRFSHHIKKLPNMLESLHLNNSFANTLCDLSKSKLEEITLGNIFSNQINLPITIKKIKISSKYKYLNELKSKHKTNSIILTY